MNNNATKFVLEGKVRTSLEIRTGTNKKNHFQETQWNPTAILS